MGMLNLGSHRSQVGKNETIKSSSGPFECVSELGKGGCSKPSGHNPPSEQDWRMGTSLSRARNADSTQRKWLRVPGLTLLNSQATFSFEQTGVHKLQVRLSPTHLIL